MHNPLKLTLAVLVVAAGLRQLHAQPPSAAQPGGESPLLVEPTTPEGFLRAATLMQKLARPVLAQRYLQKLLDAKPDDATLLALRDKYGPATFLRLRNDKTLQPQSIDLLDRVNAAFKRQGADPVRMDRLLDDLNKGGATRDAALLALRDGGTAVMPRIIARLADPNRIADRENIVYALARMGSISVAPLLGALDAPDKDVRAAVIQALSDVPDNRVVRHLWFPAFGPDQPMGVREAARGALARVFKATQQSVDDTPTDGVADLLSRIARKHFRGEYKNPDNLGPAGQPVALWTWSTKDATGKPQQTVRMQRVSPRVASMFFAARFARQALAISPENTRAQALYLATLFGGAADPQFTKPLPTGPGSIHDLALTSGAAVAGQSLSVALELNDTPTAVAALQVLGQIASRGKLGHSSAEVSPVTASLNHPDKRVQFAAAAAILQLDPDKSFRGANRVVSILARALSDDGNQRALVVHPNPQTASTISGYFAEMGYEPQIAATGMDGFRLAASRSDVELIVLHANVIRWPLSLTIANLRADSRTAGIPIVVYGSADTRKAVARLIGRYPRIAYVIESSTSAAVAMQLKPFLAQIKSPPLTPGERDSRMATAVYWLSHVANGRRTNVFDLKPAETSLMDAANDPKLAIGALQALAAIPTRAVQQKLQQMALNKTAAAPIREIAALQLAFHVQKYGLMLADGAVLAVMTAHRAETNADVATALASVVGALKPNARRVGDRLKQHAPNVQQPTN